MSEPLILKEIVDRVFVITLNRPEAHNALSKALVAQLNEALREAEASPAIGAIVLKGHGQAFSAGADILEMQALTFSQAAEEDFTTAWEELANCRKPVIAAVSGFALGGGCELAMMCDIIFAADTAQFGQPEITLGIIPGGGGTQRLTRLIGKTKAIELCLTGRLMSAHEAEQCGLVTRVIPADRLFEETLAVAGKIAAFSQPAVQMIKEAVRASENMSLEEGMRLERRLFQSTFALEDTCEGMAAFVEKRKPNFKNK